MSDDVVLYFEDDNEDKSRKPFIAKAPLQFTNEDIDRHQTMHPPPSPMQHGVSIASQHALSDGDIPIETEAQLLPLMLTMI